MAKHLVALVTGGSRGIGAAVCEALARKGMSVAVVGRSVDAASSVAASLPSVHNLKHIGFGCDVTHSASIKELFQTFRAEYGSIDVLVNCAGARVVTCVFHHTI